MIFCSKDGVDVRLVRSSLVASFAKATPPLVWNFDLKQTPSFTLALQGDDGDEWELGVMSLSGDFSPVARFPVREDAEEALAAVSAALANGRFGWVVGTLRILGLIVLGLLIVQFGLSALVGLMHRGPQRPFVERDMMGAPPQPIAPSSLPLTSPPPNGVPLPADEVLQPPSP
jgi:hypothetical protein